MEKPFSALIFDGEVFEVESESLAYSKRQRRKRAGWSDYGRYYPGSRGLR